MKRISFLIITSFLLLAFASCRKEAVDMPNPDLGYGRNYNDFEHQFITIWTGINSSYVHWSVDTVDWNKRYNKLLPSFRHLDSAVLYNTNIPNDQRYVPFETFSDLYLQLFKGLIDHHMNIMIRNIAPAPGEEEKVFAYRPGLDEAMSRPNFENLYSNPQTPSYFRNALLKLVDESRITEFHSDTCAVDGKDFAVTSCLIDGKYAYIRLTKYWLQEVIEKANRTPEEQRVVDCYNHWMELCFRPSTQGIILDNRLNTGGIVSDLQYVVAPFLANDLTVAYTRTKSGLHPLDYTPWAPLLIYKAQQTRTDIPYVVIASSFSVSMGETSTAAIQTMPNCYFIGERTFGGHGALDGIFTNSFSGTFGDREDYHFVYTTSHQMKYVNGGILEGKGIIPDQEVPLDFNALSQNSDDNQLDAALQYLHAQSK